MNIPKYLKQYQELPYIEKRMLQLRALSRDNLSKTDFLKIINQSDLKISLGKQYTHDNLTAIFKSLTNKNLLTENYCNPIIIHYILMDAVNGEYSDNNINSILNAASNNELLVDKLRLGIYLNNLKFFQEAIINHQILDHHKKILINLSNWFTSII